MGPGNRDIPDAMFNEVGFKLPVDRCLNVEEDQGASDVKKESSRGEMPSWTYPVMQRISVQ